MGTNSDDESESRKKLKSSETNANTGMRFNAQESCIEFSLGRCTYGEQCRYVHDIGNANQRICQFLVSGRQSCPYRDRCRFRHEAGVNKANSGIVPNPYDYDYDAKSENLSNEPRPSCAIHISPNDDRGKSKILPNDPHNAAPVKRNEEVRRVGLESSTGYGASKNAEPESQRGKLPAKLGNLKRNSQVYGDWIQDLD